MMPVALKFASANSLSLCAATTVASSRMQAMPSRARSAILTGGSGPACAHACRRARFTAALTFRRVRSPPAAASFSARHAAGTDTTAPNSSCWSPHHPEIADHPGPDRDRARQIGKDPAPVMPARRRRQRRRQAGRQARPVRHLAQQDQPRVRHDARAAAPATSRPRDHPVAFTRKALLELERIRA
jgi:hypothetical protein